MSFTKHWTEQGDKTILRDEQLDDAAEAEYAAHCDRECWPHCQHCEADRHCQRYSFDRLHDAFVTSFKKGVPRP